MIFSMWSLFRNGKSSVNLDQNTFKFVTGNSLTERYTHTALNFYFLGAFLGFSYFYYKDVLSKQPFIYSNDYVPFIFCFKLITKLDNNLRERKVISIIIFVFIILLKILLSSANYIHFIAVNKINKSGLYILNFDLKIIDKLVDCSEKILNGVLTYFIILFLLILPKENRIKVILNSMGFPFIERISFEFLLIFDFTIYIIYSTFIPIVILNYQNLLALSFSYMTVCIILSILLYIFSEIHFKKGIKYLINEKVTHIDDETNKYSE